ncbi:MAG: hydrogenase maturation nickel metallochaperone HypA [Candidatus Hydrogenedentota bacterium]
MHEYSIAKNIMDSLTELKPEYQDKPVIKVTILAGRLHRIVPESLFFYLDLLKKDSEFKDTEFVFREKDVEVRCSTCNNISKLADFFLFCPLCNSLDVRLVSGNELVIESIEIEEKEDGDKSL